MDINYKQKLHGHIVVTDNTQLVLNSDSLVTHCSVSDPTGGMDSRNIVEEIDAVEVLDVLNEVFGGIDIDWTELNTFFISRKEGEKKKEDLIKTFKEVKSNKHKRERPRSIPFKSEDFRLRRDVSAWTPLGKRKKESMC